MTDQPDRIVLVYLRRIDETLDRVMEDIRGLKPRMTNIIEELVWIRRRLNGVDVRLGRIEHRLDLIGNAALRRP